MGNALNDHFASMRAVGPADNISQQGQETNGLGYANNLSKQNAKNVFARQDFVQDLFDYYYERDGKTFGSVDEAKDYFMEDRRWRNMNLVSIGRDLYDANSQSDEQSTRLARLQTTFDALPDFYQEGGDGWRGFATNALATLADPINLVGFGSGGIAAREAAKQAIIHGSAKGLIGNSLKKEASRAALKAGVYKGALYEAGASGLAEGVLDAGIQARNTELGLQDGYSVAQGAMAVGAGATIGGVMGGALGGAAAKIANPFAGLKSQTTRGIEAGRKAVVDQARADVDASTKSGVRQIEEEETLTPAQAQIQELADLQAQVVARTTGTRHTGALSPEMMEDGASSAMGGDGPATSETINASALSEEDVLDLAADQMVNLNRMADELAGKASAESNIDKQSALARTSRQMRNEVSRIKLKLQKFVSEEITQPEDLEELLQITDQSDLLSQGLLENNLGRGITDGPATPTGDGTVRNLTGAETTAQQKNANRFRQGDDGLNPAGDVRLNRIDVDTKGGNAPDEGPDVRMGPQEEGRTDLSDADQDFKDRLEITDSRKKKFEDDVVAKQEELRVAQEEYDGTPDLDKETNDKFDTEIVKILEEGLQGDVTPELRAKLEGTAQAAQVPFAPEDTAAKLIQKLKNARVGGKDALLQKVRGLETELADLKVSQVDNNKLIDTETAEYVQSRNAAKERATNERLAEDLRLANEQAEADAAAAQARSDAANPEKIYDNGKTVAAAEQYLTDIDVDAKDIAEFKSIDGRTPAKKAKFVELFYKKMGEHQLAHILNDLSVDGEVNINIVNTDPMGDTGKTFLEAMLEGATPEMRAATIAAQERALANPKVIDSQIEELMKSGEVADGPTGFFDAAQKFGGVNFANRLVARLEEIALQTQPLPERKMSTPSGEKPWGMKVEGAEVALPSGNFATENAANIDGRMKHFESILDDTFNEELITFKEKVRAQAIDAGYSDSKANEIASKMYYERIDKMAAGNESFVSRNIGYLNGRISEIKSHIQDMKAARQKYLNSYSSLPPNFKSEFTREEGVMTVIGQDGRPVEFETFRYNLNQGKAPTDAEKKLIVAHYENLARLKEVRDRYKRTSGKNVVLKKGSQLNMGDLINSAEDEVSTLNRKKNGTIEIRTRGMRLTTDVSVTTDAGLADFMGRSQIRDGRGVYEENGKIQSILRTVGARGFTGKLIRSGYKRGSDGVAHRVDAIENALNESYEARIKGGTQQVVRNDEKAARNKQRLEVLEYHITLIEKLKSGIANLKKNKTKTFSLEKGGAKLTLPEVEDALFAAENDARTNVTNIAFITNSDSQTVIGGLKNERSKLRTSTEQEMLGDKVAAAKEDFGRTILKKTAIEVTARHHALVQQENNLKAIGKSLSKEDTNLLEFLITMRKQQNKLVQYHLGKGTPIDVEAAKRLAKFAYTKARKVAYAKKKYEEEVAAGYFDYENSVAAGEERLGEIDEEATINNAAYLEHLSRATSDGEADPDLGYAAYFDGEPNVDQKAQIETQVDAINEQATSKKAAVADYNALAEKAKSGALSREELIAAVADLQAKVQTLASADTPNVKPLGVKNTPIIATTPSGIEVDLNNDIKYFRSKADQSIRVELDGQVLGRYTEDENGVASIMHPDGMKLKFKSGTALKKSLAQIFKNKIEDMQAKSGGNRFAVNQNAKGLPHTQTNLKKTETYKNEKTVVAPKGSDTPEISPPAKSDPNNVLTHSTNDFEELPDGRSLAIQFLDKGSLAKIGEVRKIGRKKNGDPQVIGDLLGKSADVPYVIGHVQTGGSRATDRETFFPMTVEDTFVDQNGNKLAGLDVEKGKRGVTQNVQSQRKRENRASDFETIRSKDLVLSEQDRLFFQGHGEPMRTIDDLVNFIDRIETVDWQGEIKSLKGLKRFATLRAAASRVLKSNVPNGIKQPSTNLGVSANKLRSMFDGYPDREVQTAVDFLERVAAYNGGRAPLLAKATGDEASFDPNTNEIKIVVGSDKAQRPTPMSMELVHEMGHWIYENLLDEGDKQKFWSSLEKYYDDNAMRGGGELDFDALSRGLVDTELVPNAASNPQEFFANQFLGYVLQTDALRVPGSPMMQVFEKVSRFGHAIMNWMLGRETFKVDPDLAEIFSKYLPNEEIDPLTGTPERGVSKFGHLEKMGEEHGIESQSQMGQGEMPMAQFAAKQMVALDERIRDLQIAKMANPKGMGDSFALAVELEKIAKSIYGEYGGKKGQPKHAKIPGRPDSGSTRIMALDYANDKTILEDIMQAQYKIHGFLKALRAEEADHKFADALSGKNQTDVAQQNAIASEMSTDTQRDVQDMYEKMLTQSKSAYEGLDEAIVDRLHALSTDLQVAMQRGIGEYTRIYKRMMPHTQRKHIAIDEFTGASYVETVSPKSAKFRQQNAKQNREELQTARAVSEIVQQLTNRGVDWRKVSEDAIMDEAKTRAAKAVTEEEHANAIHNASASEDAENLNGLASSINEVKKRVSYVVTDSASFIAKLERDDSPILAILRGTDEAQKAKLMAMAEADPTDFNLAILDYGRKHGASSPDTPEPISTDPVTPAVSQFSEITVRGLNKTQQGIAHDLFIKMIRKIKLLEDESIEIPADVTVNELDLAAINGDPRAMDFDEDAIATPQGPAYDRARKKIREMANHIDKINDLRENYKALSEGGQREMEKEYDASVTEHRTPLFEMLYDFSFALQDKLVQKSISEMPLEGVAAFKDRFARMTTKDLYNDGTVSLKGSSPEQFVALKQMVDEATQILDGILFQPKSRAERKMEVRRIATADLDMAERGKHAIQGMVTTPQGEVLVHPAVAGKYANSMLKTMSARLENAVRDFVGLTPKADLRNRLRFNVSSDQNVRGVTATTNGDYGDGVYLKSTKHVDADYSAEQVYQKAQADMSMAGITDAQKVDEINGLMQTIIRQRESIRDLSNMSSLSFDQKRLLSHTIKKERLAWDTVRDLTNGIAIDQKVSPVFARIRSPLNVSSKQTYSLSEDSDGTVRNLLVEMADRKILDAEGIQSAVTMFAQPMPGRNMYSAFTNGTNGLLVQSGAARNGADARLKFNKLLKDLNYDGLVTDEGEVVFDPTMVKAADSFKSTDALNFEGETFGGDMKLTGQVVEEMMVQNGRLENPAFVGVAREARRMGVPKPVLDVTQKIFKQHRIGEHDVEKISKWSTVKNFFRENSSLFRQLGANWFGDLIKPVNGVGTFEKHDAMLARRLQPIIAKLNELPDSGNNFQRWNRRNRGLAMGALDVGQPASHKRIIQALRRGRGAVQLLDPAERQVALDIGEAFADELSKMKALGMRVGDTRQLGSDYYVPQVWDTEAMLANPKRFHDSLVEFLRREQNSPDFDDTRSTLGELRETATAIASKITRGNDHTVDGELQMASSDPFASRVLNLKPGDLEFMDEFLVQDLQGILAKYYDRTIRKRVLTEQFGVNGHAFNAYADIAQSPNAIDAAMAILGTEYRPKTAVTTESGMGEVDDLVVPRLNLTQTERRGMANRLRQMLGDPETNINNKQAAISMIIEAAGPDAYNNVQFRKRVEAVVNATIDFAGGQPPPNTVVKMKQMFDVLNKKPIDGGTGQEARYKVSRALKSFTSVSLLGFTMFTSIPDVSLPLIRSGNMRAFAKTWAKYATDPSYRAAAKNIGVGIDNLMHERMVHMSGEGNQKFANAFFNATLLTPWTNTMREVASLVGFESFKSEIDRAMRLKRKGKTDTKSYQTAVRYLERYGLTGENATHDFLGEGSFRIDTLPKDEAIQQQVQMAMIRFTNESIFTPNPNDLPMWGQTPWGGMMFQLKSFPMLMMKLQGYIMDEFKQGNTAPAFYMLTAGVGAGMVAVGVKDYVQMRGGEDERSAEARKRSLTESKAGLAKVLGVKEGDDLDAALGWYIDGLLAVGGLGLIGELLYNTSAQLDNGKYGFVRTMSGIFGPQVGTAELAFNVAAGTGQAVSNAVSGEDSNSKIRTALRDVYGRIPVAGRIYGGPAGREAFVDAVGGEAKKPGRKKGSGSSKGFGSSKFNSTGFGGGGFG